MLQCFGGCSVLSFIHLFIHCYILQIQESHDAIRHYRVCILGVVLGLIGEPNLWGLRLEQRSPGPFTFLFTSHFYSLTFLLAFFFMCTHHTKQCGPQWHFPSLLLFSFPPSSPVPFSVMLVLVSIVSCRPCHMCAHTFACTRKHDMFLSF